MTDQEIFKKTRKILYANMVKSKRGGMHFHYTKPSIGRYPYQFYWDTCFHAFIFVALGDHNMAKEHLRSLYSMQKEDGFVGHMIYWDRLKPGRFADFLQSHPRMKNLYKSHMSALVQPPMAPQALAKIHKASGDTSFLKEMLPKIKAHFSWLEKNRDFDGSGLLTIISPFESGMDFKPTYDIALGMNSKKAGWHLFMKVVSVDLRNYLNDFNLKKVYKQGYFLVKDAGFNSIYAKNLETLADLCGLLNDPDQKKYRLLANSVTQQIIRTMYDENDIAFYDVYGKNDIKINVLTPTIFYPLVLKHMPDNIARRVINKHFQDGSEFETPFPLPSVAKNHPSFYPKQSMFLWRGPSWIVNNWFIHQFLVEKGFKDEAQKLINVIRELIEKSGFREYYHPFTGQGLGAKDFTWAGLITDMIQNQ